MKIIIRISVVVLLLSMFFIFAKSANFSGDTDTQSNVGLISMPELPSELSFAGESVPLDNYDTRESLNREILITQNMHSRTMTTLLLTTRYFPIIEPILKEQGIPQDFRYLCMVESSLDANIASPAGAAGLWQLMPAVGRENGMVVGKDVDQRYHIEKATYAACDHLQESYDKFGNWTLAAAAYNLGLTGVSTRSQRQSVDNYYDLYMPAETMRYVFRILSMKLVCENPKKYGYNIDKEDYYKPLKEYKIVSTDAQFIDWSEFAHENGTTYKMLRELNHWIRSYDYTNNARRSFEIKVPTKKFRDR